MHGQKYFIAVFTSSLNFAKMLPIINNAHPFCESQRSASIRNFIASSWSPSSESIWPMILWYSEFVGFEQLNFWELALLPGICSFHLGHYLSVINFLCNDSRSINFYCFRVAIKSNFWLVWTVAIFVNWSVPLMRSVWSVPGETFSSFLTSLDLSHFFCGSPTFFKRSCSSANSVILKCSRSSCVRMFTAIGYVFLI